MQQLFTKGKLLENFSKPLDRIRDRCGRMFLLVEYRRIKGTDSTVSDPGTGIFGLFGQHGSGGENCGP